MHKYSKYNYVSSGEKRTNSTEYEALDGFPYPGKTEEAIPVSFRMRAMIQEGAANASIRIFDVDNGEVICEKTDVSLNEYGMIDLGAIDNLPDEEAYFEVQAKSGTSGKYVYVTNVVYAL